jgi:hypothetical protein
VRVRPRRNYHARKVSEAVKYLQSVRLGPSERGSYVLTAFSPVGPLFRRQQPTLGPDFEHEPFPRLVTLKLAEALKAVKSALSEVAATDDFSAFEKAVPHGVSANLCDAIANLSHHAKGVEIGLTWARVRPGPEANQRHPFTSENARILEEAAREFRKDEPRLDETVTGFVIALDRGPDEFNGNATLLVLLEDKPRRIRVEFGKREYDNVIRAFKDKLLVALDGDLYQVGQRYELRNPRNLVFLRDEEELSGMQSI